MSEQKKPVTLIVENEITCKFVGLDKEHLELFINAYALHSKGYRFHPAYKLGSWDGKIRFFTGAGQTYVTLIEEIVPALHKLGYTVTVKDNRAGTFFSPPLVDKDFFSHIISPETGLPIELRDYQVDYVNMLTEAGNGIGVAATSAGKAQPLDARIMTPSGWRRMGEIEVGDEITAADGTNVRVTGVFPQGTKQIYRVTFHDGTSTECCEEHLWGVFHHITPHVGEAEYRIMSLRNIMQLMEREPASACTSNRISVPIAAPVEWNNPTSGTIAAYTMGALLGTDCVTQSGELSEKLKRYGLVGCCSNSKFIPMDYMHGSLADRCELIRGLMDVGGVVDGHGNASYGTDSHQLALDVQELIQSLGGICVVTSGPPSASTGDEEQGRAAYQLRISYPDTAPLFSSLGGVERCANTPVANEVIGKWVVDVIEVGSKEAQCIMVDHPDHLYITDDYIVTHNTILCGALVENYRRVGATSMIIVPNTDLIRQTRRELEFLEVETGEYSGKTKDVNGRDIVVSTWQALQHNPTILTDRNVIMVDETHGAKGTVLQKLLTQACANVPHRFGVTGTMPEDQVENLSVRCALGPVLATIDAATLIKKGVLATLDIDIIELQEDLTEQYDEYCRTYEDAGVVDYKTFKESFFPDYAAEKKHLTKNLSRLEWIANHVNELRAKGNVFVLIPSVPMGRKLAELTPSAKFVHGDDEDAVRAEAYQLFKDNNDIVVYATYGVASTGLSINRINELVLVDIGKSYIRVIQSIGRGLRKAPDKSHVHVTDICSGLKYSKQHQAKRKQMYKKVEYPFKTKKVVYQASPTYNQIDTIEVK